MIDLMVGEQVRRMHWADLPEVVRAAVEEVLGSHVVQADSQMGGYSTGTADRVLTAMGTRAFVKVTSTRTDEHAAALHRREAKVSAVLPDDVPAPILLGTYDDGDWVALVFEDIDGHHPALPWKAAELFAVLDALDALATRLTPTPLVAVPRATEVLAEHFAGWQRILADPPADLDGWAAAHLLQLCALAADGLAALEGDTLVHYDVRADNLLLRWDGSVVVLDWPWACRGPVWLDTLLLAQDVHLHGGHDADAVLKAGPAARADPAVITAVLVGLTGYSLDASRRPASAGMERLRVFQRAKADALLPWIQQRLTSYAST